MEKNKNEVEQLLKIAWSRNSSLNPSAWSEETPTVGQCSATALVVNDMLGGEIYKCDVKTPFGTGTHYLNKIDDELVDYTKDQFHNSIKLENYSKSSREEIFSEPKAIMAYTALLENMTSKAL